MLSDIYNTRILELAANIPRLGRLERPDASATAHSRLCGSTVIVDLAMQDGRVVDFAHDVKACALGQASASILARQVVGLGRTEIARARAQLAAMLKSDGPVPDAPFQDYEVLLPARDYRNRHASILLALDATLEAFDQAAKAA